MSMTKVYTLLLGGFLLALVSGLSACGGETTPVNTTPTNGKPTQPILLPTPTPRPLVQPKIVRSVTSPRGTIDFTEAPDLNDGWPTLVWFDAVNSIFSDKMAPTINTFKERYRTRIKFADLDFYDDGSRQLGELFRINSPPSFVVVDRNGRPVKSWIGMVEPNDLEGALKQVSGS